MSTETYAGAGSATQMAASGAAVRGTSSYAQFFPQDQILRQETHVGMIRELVPPQEHIGLQIAPWLEVASDDVVFDYIRDSGTGMAPARAEDAESQLWRDDEMYQGQGRASVIDWAEKSYYTASDVSRYREMRQVIEQVENGNFPLTVRSILEGFDARVARDIVSRRRRLDNRIEWLITQALSTGKIIYDDGRIKFNVDFLRPPDQHNQPAASNGGDYSGTAHDPINDILAVQEKIFAATGVTVTRAYASRKYLNSLYKSSKFTVLSGFAPGAITASDMPYALPGWGPKAAIETIEAETGIRFIPNDNVMRVRAVGSKNFVNTRYFPENQVLFLPEPSAVQAYDDTEIGFAKTLTSPHPMNNWQPGFYGWEAEVNDPWGREIGSGVKAFPVFPHLELTYTMLVTL